MCWEGGWECANPFWLLMPVLFCVEGFTLPLPPPGDPGFLVPDPSGRVPEASTPSWGSLRPPSAPFAYHAQNQLHLLMFELML